MRRRIVMGGVLGLLACSSAPVQPPDGGGVDAGLTDAGPTDAGLTDAGTDAGFTDAGTADAGRADAGWPDAGSGPLFYVATTGSDSNPGTLALPWRTIQHAALGSSGVGPGATVYVRGGSYRELVSVNVSGSADGGRVTFQSYPGETATLDGTGLTVTGQQGLFTLLNQSYLTLAGFELKNLTDNTTANVPAGIMVSGEGDWIQLLNNHIHHISTTGTQTPGCTNTSTSPNSNAFGLVVYGTHGATPITHLTIDGNELDHLVLGCSESLTVNGNVRFFSVTHNTVHDNNNIGIDAIGFEGVSPTKATDQARDGVISDNVVYNIDTRGAFGVPPNGAYADSSADGIYLDGAARVIVERNLVFNVDLGIELASEIAGTDTSDCVARNNLVFNNIVVGISIGGYSNAVGGTSNCTVVNNTLYRNDTRSSGTGELQVMFHAVGNTVANNIISAGGQGVLVSNVAPYAPAQAAFDYNLYFAPAGAPTLWSYNAGASSYPSLAAFKATTLEAHGLVADPQFVAAAANPKNLDVLVSSPAIDAGVNLGAALVGAVDYAGNPRVGGAGITIGAYQH